jgi:hypothetical protein
MAERGSDKCQQLATAAEPEPAVSTSEHGVVVVVARGKTTSNPFDELDEQEDGADSRRGDNENKEPAASAAATGRDRRHQREGRDGEDGGVRSNDESEESADGSGAVKYYPNCDARIWLRTCENEVVEPLHGVVKG